MVALAEPLIAVFPMQTEEIDNIVPFPGSTGGPEGPMGGIGVCPVCHRKLVDAGDPEAATSIRDFLRRSHAADPHHYHAVLKANPVNANVTRDEKSREVLTDFDLQTRDDEDSDHNARQQVDQRIYREWLSQQFN